MKWIQQLIYWIVILGYLIVVMCYNLIENEWGFTYTDEIFALLLLGIYLRYHKYAKNSPKEFFQCCIVFIFYLFYSCIRRIVPVEGILMDLFIQIKSFLVFYVIYTLGVGCSSDQKKVIEGIVKIIVPLLVIVGFMGIDTQFVVFSHPSRYATVVCITGFLYLYCSKRRKNDIVITLLIWSLGILSERSKFYGFFTLAFCLMLFVHPNRQFKLLKPKSIIVGIILIGLIFWAAKDKVLFYVIDGTQGQEVFVRPALYITMISVLRDYPLLGPGFGSYATWASGVFYSSLYTKYGIDNLWGLTEDKYSFVADTFYPSLAQYGLIGIMLFFNFWILVYRKSQDKLKRYNDVIVYKSVLLIIAFFMIESLADSTFTNNRGLYMMIILALFLNDNKGNRYIQNSR